MGFYNNYLEYHGILGRKWGVRRFQNADGSLTAAGQKHYGASSVNTGKDVLRDMAITGALNAAGIGLVVIPRHRAEGKSYKVKEKKDTTSATDSKPIVMVTPSEAKKAGLDNSTRLSKKEESEFWKAYAKK